MTTISINDVQVELIRCDHCGVEPGEQQALDAIARHERMMGIQTCACCGGRIKPTRYDLIHLVIGEPEGVGAQWVATPDLGEEPLMVRSRRGGVAEAGLLHRACAIRILPHLPEGVLADGRAVWPAPERRNHPPPEGL